MNSKATMNGKPINQKVELEGGEFIVNKAATNKNLKLLQKINNEGIKKMNPEYVKKYSGVKKYAGGSTNKSVVRTKNDKGQYIYKEYDGDNTYNASGKNFKKGDRKFKPVPKFNTAAYKALQTKYNNENKEPDEDKAPVDLDLTKDDKVDKVDDNEDISEMEEEEEPAKKEKPAKKEEETQLTVLPKNNKDNQFAILSNDKAKDAPLKFGKDKVEEENYKNYKNLPDNIKQQIAEYEKKEKEQALNELTKLQPTKENLGMFKQLANKAGLSKKGVQVNNEQSAKNLKRKAQDKVLSSIPEAPSTIPKAPSMPSIPKAPSVPLSATRPSATLNPTPSDNKTSGLKLGEDKKPDKSMYPVEVQKYFVGADYSALLNYVKSKNSNKLKDKTVEYLRKLCQDLAQSLGVALKYNGTNKEFLLLQLYELLTIQIGKKRTEQKQKNENPDTKMVAMVDFEQLLGKGSKLDMNKLDEKYANGGQVKMMASGGKYDVNTNVFKKAFQNNPKGVASDVGSTQGRTLQSNALYLDGLSNTMRDIVPEEEGAVSNVDKNKYARKTFDLGDALFGVEKNYSKRNAEKLQEAEQLYKPSFEFKYASKPKKGKQFIIDFA